MSNKMTGDTARKILGVDFKTTLEELKKVYRKLAMKFHPDREGGSEEKFKEVKEAYEYLEKNGNSKDTKNYYDQKERDDFNTHFKDIFRDTYGSSFDDYGGKTGSFYDRNCDREYDHIDSEVTIDIKDAFEGQTIHHYVSYRRTKYHYVLTIPAGIKDGERIPFEGNSWIKTEYVECKVYFYVSITSNDSIVNWKGSYDGSRIGDITQEIAISPFKMIMGGWERIKTLDGKEVDIRIPAGQKSNRKLKVKGKGYWKNADRDLDRGDLYLVTVPNITKVSELSQDSKNEIRQLYEMLRKEENTDDTPV